MKKGSWNGPSLAGWEFCSSKRGEEDIGLMKAGKGTKRMLATDGKGIPLAFLLARANCAEVKLGEGTLERIRVSRKRGQPRKRPARLVADRAYDSDPFRRWLSRKRVCSSIPPRENRRGQTKKSGGRIRGAWRVRRTFAWLGSIARIGAP